MPQSLTITDAEIAAVASALHIDVGDEQRRNVLRVAGTCDIQACPGSGKTTLLVAKLAILAAKWAWPDRGICVLSHTNAARHEVEHRLANHTSARRLLAYPHFIGTIQAFTDRFLGLPQLWDDGLDVHAVDDDRFASEAVARFQARCYATARNYLERRGGSEGVVTRLTFQGHDLSVICPGRNLPRPTTATMRQLARLKGHLRDDGIFRYDDMYAYAERRIEACPALIVAIGYRFPWVFIDEIQDTNNLQESLLQKLFGEAVILQRFGDANQAIFGGIGPGKGQASFPGTSHLTVSASKRFGRRISQFASKLAIVASQTLEGVPDRLERSHTIFTFDADSVHSVLPAFGGLVLEEFAGRDLKGSAFKAVGAIRRDPDSPEQNKFPQSIGAYWTAFDPVVSNSGRHFGQFVDFVRAARGMVQQNGECAQSYGTLLSAFLSRLHLANARTAEHKRFSRLILLEALTEHGLLDSFRDLMRELCLGDTRVDEAQWKRFTERIAAVLKPIVQLSDAADIGDFMSWRLSGTASGAAQAGKPDRQNNFFRHKRNGREVSIEVTTIHAVKGQTHTGTLVLETFWKEHDIGDAYTWLADGAKRTKARLGVERKERLKRLYVAATRPTDLLCLALHRDRLPSCLANALKSDGWSIVDLR